ncbi:hypothetical protein [Sphingobacterium composti Ten et al. 2007 non Yoo et al. 2007]|uniref:hypothetical protein n=1 Tax=Sphingobacterium composti TaxID=363260 RepID=UPI001357E80C|nr:hypothetical protein [Sphingobacterium composti Ten et al. 2007 non Yoo et al. 2007]
MLTFEEFFIKKKIDLSALRKADESLFFEFKDHYAQMGEKSFDHSKKFWFNRLRKVHPLAEEAEVVKKETNVVLPADTKIPSKHQITTAAPTAKPAGFKPRFKAPIKTNVEEVISEQPNIDATEVAVSAKPAGFKPRFKAGVTKTPSTEESIKGVTPVENKEEITSEPASKPAGFKPRFKAGVTKSTPTEETIKDVPPVENKEEITSEPANKPAGFKPRFKAGVTKSTPTEETTKDVPPVENKEENTSEPANKPTGFKPRFKAGVTKTKPASEDNS